jgi:hypothetical protein
MGDIERGLSGGGTGLLLGFVLALVLLFSVGSAIVAVWALVRSRRETTRLEKVLSNALETVGRLADLVGRIDPQYRDAAYDIQVGVRRAKAGGTIVASLKPVAKTGKHEPLDDFLLWGKQAKARGFKDQDGVPYEGEELEEAKRCAAEAERLEGVRA